MKRILATLVFIIVLAAFLSSCIASRGNWSDCPSHDKNYFKYKVRA